MNGLRILPIIECGKQASECHGPDQCSHKRPPHCQFLESYKNNLEKLDFNQLINDLENLAVRYQLEKNIKEEIIIVLIVYETPKNLCSERQTLINYFNNHGVECKELDYPIS